MEPYTKELITWAKHLDVVKLHKRIGYLPGYIVMRLFKDLTEEEKGDARINVGFSKNKKRFYVKLSSRGVKLSEIGDGKSRIARTFCLQRIRGQFGDSIIGEYRLLEGAGFDEGKILGFERLDDDWKLNDKDEDE
jgi:hypothetical protein